MMSRCTAAAILVLATIAACEAHDTEPAAGSANLAPGDAVNADTGVWEFIYIVEAGSFDAFCFEATRRQAEVSLYIDHGTPDEAHLFSVPPPDGSSWAPAHPLGAEQGTGVFLSESWHTLYVPGGIDGRGEDAPLTLYENRHDSDEEAPVEATGILPTPDQDGLDNRTYVLLDGYCP
jgi:hypothetical protein